ncbi:zinc-binding dehydrogenase [Sinorhizobium meliloti]|uniref:zinc-binding dehydrogenase n=1 Tax=Rhizobium meliloti TaxID=382 RepID=UPI001F1B1E07|nr:zinc-binding dehydrogenase [Sinorhizobium meliloti]
MGASGAVGGALLQLARSRGWIVHAVCSAAQSARVLRLGAATVLDYRQDDWREIAARRAESQPLNAIVDMVSGEHAASLAPLLTANGHLVCIQDRQEKTPLPPFTTTISLHEVGLTPCTPMPTIRNGAGWWAPARQWRGISYRAGSILRLSTSRVSSGFLRLLLGWSMVQILAIVSWFYRWRHPGTRRGNCLSIILASSLPSDKPLVTWPFLEEAAGDRHAPGHRLAMKS